MQSHQFVLTYWNIRGTTQAIRYLLEYVRVDYEDRALVWPSDKIYNVRDLIDYPKMPCLNHKGFEVLEIVPIGKYICRASNRAELLGKTLRDEVTIDSFISKTFHARNIYLEAMSGLENGDESIFEQQMFEKMKVLRMTFLQELSEILSYRDWYMGYLTLADFILYNVLIYFKGFVPSLITQEPIEKYLQRFETLEPLREYFENGKGDYQPAITELVNKKWKGKRYNS